ncbi:MAG: carboxylesterase family protein [Hydrogenophaga sp.]|uniref:carboxylesterase/lipase family protein n=1 Tax=Hydrogenophaga sp. TaxID=1904254 RepID=UPI002ABB0071|nr:carboxylesterase family protein [Hydrogenophaga sp.]MDZ4176258.1 carboxylesterase family protein [Hydrogenophaga sp.]
MTTHHMNRREWLGAGAALGLGSLGLSSCAAPGAKAITGASGDAPIATVAQGQLQGKRNGEVLTFKRVPYAANPYLAANRFKAPQPMPAWSGTRDAASSGPMPPQPSRAPGGGLAGAPDDLTMDIWAPINAQGAPVLVWLPGGAFYRVNASETWYDGSAYAREGVVVVTVNYRVGIDGFMWVEGMPPNRGYLDQVAALQWVKQNIAAFGGNPGNITLAGQSAGAQSVMALMGMPAAKGLFHQAIAQSPPQNHFTPEQARRIAAATAAELKVAPTAQALASAPMAAVITATERMVTDLRDRAKWGPIGGQPPYLPVVDGAVVTDPPQASLTRHAHRAMPLLIGSTDDEARLYLVPGGAIDRIPAPAFAGALKGANLPPNAAQVYAQTRANASPGDMLAAFESDSTFRIPALRYAETRLAAGAPTWNYHFAWQSPGFGGRLGAGHVVDVPYVFNTLTSQQAGPFLGGTGHQPLADTMFGHWLRFIKTGNPGWARYDLTQRPTMRFDTTSAVVSDPLPERRQLWANKTFN